MKKILVNLVTLQHGHILPPWLRTFKVFQNHGCEVYINAGPFVKKLDPIGNVYEFKWLSDEEIKMLQKDKTVTKFGFMFHCLKRNYLALKNNRKIVEIDDFDIIYTASAVLDFVILPYYFKLKRREIKWVTTWANIVPFTDPGNRIARFLAWVFFQTSLRMIKKADAVFAFTPEVMEYAHQKDFDRKRLVLTGCGIESDMIEKARSDEKFQTDALFMGRINETKGIFDLLEALKIVRGKYPDFQLAVMGEGA